MVEAVFFDIDGVLTDGMVYIDSAGNESKRISFDDIDAIFELKKAGVKVGFITGEQNAFTRYVKKRFSPDFFVTGCPDKLSCFQEIAARESLDESKVCFVGDSKKDAGLLGYLQHSFAPSDADTHAKKSAKFITKATKGTGVIKEVAEFILNKRTRGNTGHRRT